MAAMFRRSRSLQVPVFLGGSACGLAITADRFRRPLSLATARNPAVLVIGGTGLMGAPTARLLQQQGYDVVIMTRGSAAGMGIGGSRPEQAVCKTWVCDREDEAAFSSALCDPQCPSIIVDFTAMNTKHIKQVAAAHRKRSLEHYVFISTNMVYPGGPEDMDITGLAQPVPEHAADLDAAEAAPDTYGGRKLKCEALLQRASSDESLPYSVLRPPSVVGPGCDNRHERLQRLAMDLPPLTVPRRLLPATRNAGQFRVACSQDVATAVAGIIALGSASHGEAYNVASGDAMTIHEYMAAIAAQLGIEAAAVPADPALRNYERQGVLETKKLEKAIGFQPTPLGQWMRETVTWHTPMLGSR